MANAPFPIHPELSGLTIAYRNPELIADAVLPRVLVGRQEFKYHSWTIAETFTLPDTRVGRRSQPNEVEFTGSETTSATEDFGLDDPVPQADIDNALPNQDPLARSTEGLTDLIMLDREVRTSNLVFASATYAAANRVILAGGDQWSDYASATSEPIEDIKTGLDKLIMRPNVMVLASRHGRSCRAIRRSSRPCTATTAHLES